MRVFIIIIGIIAGAVISFGLNFILVRKLENKGHRIGMQVAAYIVFIILGFLFTSIFSLHYTLDRFIDNRINYLELILSKRFQNTNILDMTIETNDIASLNYELQLAVNGIDVSKDNIFERLIFDAFLTEISKYTNVIDSGVAVLSEISNDDGTITLKNLLFGIKILALDTVSPYFFVLQILILFVFFICLGIYIGVAIYFKKGGSIYNKSIVYGDVQ